MKFYYTTSSGYNEVQQKPYLSLGGFKSGSPVLNDVEGNLFGEISIYTINKNKTEYIGLMLKNTLGVDVTGLKLWVEHPEDSYSKYQVAGVLPAQDGDGNNFIERIETRNSKPFYADFVDADIDNKYDLGALLNDGEIGVWIKRELNIDFIETDVFDVYMVDPDNSRNFLPKEKSKSDSISIKLSWD